MKLQFLATTVAALVVFAAPSFAQVTTLEGIVTGTDGKPVVGAVIKIHRTDIKWDQTVKTDKRGHYIHTGVPLGNFELTCVVEGKEVDKIANVRSTMNDHPGLDFDLRKAALMNNDATSAAVQKAMETGVIDDELKRKMSTEQIAELNKKIASDNAKVKKRKELNDFFNQGFEAVKAKQWDVAVEALNKAAENDPTQAPVFAQLGDAYSGLAGTKTGPEFDDTMGKAIAAYLKAIELKPDEANIHHNYGLALAKTHKLPEAEAELKKAAELDPPSAYLRYKNLGIVLLNSGQNEPAEKAFKMAIDASPESADNADSYYFYGTLLVGKASMTPDGKYSAPPGTVESLNKYLALAPTGANAQAAKDTIAALGATIETNFKQPGAPANKKKK